MITKTKYLYIASSRKAKDTDRVVNLDTANNQTPIVITKTRDTGYTILDTATDRIYLAKEIHIVSTCKMVCVNNTYYSVIGKMKFLLNPNKGKGFSPGILKIKTVIKTKKKEKEVIEEKASAAGFVYIVTGR